MERVEMSESEDPIMAISVVDTAGPKALKAIEPDDFAEID